MTRTDTTLQNQAASIRNLEVQMGQISNLLNARPQGTLPSNTETNLREHVKAIILQSSKELKDPIKRTNEEGETRKIEEEVMVEQKEAAKPKSKLFPNNPTPYKPPLPFPQRFQKQKLDKQFSKFL